MEKAVVLEFINLLAVAILILLTGFFVAVEFSIVKVRRSKIAQTVVKLGLDFSNVKTEQSLAKALANKGFKIKEC